MSQIKQVIARRVWDSRGRPTVEVAIRLESGAVGRAIAPAGASRGMREALDLRDGGTHLAGMDVLNAVNNVNRIIAPALIGLPMDDQALIDERLIALDPSPTKTLLGGNATVATSLAAIHAAAAHWHRPLWQQVSESYGQIARVPLPEIQIFGGGAHADRRIDIQDLMVMVPGARDFDEVLEVTAEIYLAAGELLSWRGERVGVADEGGWWPAFDSNEQALEILTLAIQKAGEKPGERVVIALDIAASEFGVPDDYRLALENRRLDTAGMLDLLGRWMDAYPIASIEDPLSERDTQGWIEFHRRFGDRVQVVGDDYLATNAAEVRAAASAGACNTLLLKVNQAGTLTEAVRAFQAAEANGWRTIVSARSGESEDVTVSHLATGLGCGQLKVGSLTRSERMAKWNECLRIQDELGTSAFVGGEPLEGTFWAQQQHTTLPSQ